MIKRLSTAAICVALVSISSAMAAPNPGNKSNNANTPASDAKADTKIDAKPEEKAVHGAEAKPEEKKAEKRVADAKGAPRKCLTTAARALLEQIEEKFGPVRVISTCRPGARIAGSGRISRHASGNAVDFDAGKRKGEIVKWLVANHKKGGTMTYPDMSHIHVDIGRHFVSLAGSRSYASRSHRSGRSYASNSRAYGGEYYGRPRSRQVSYERYGYERYSGNSSGMGRYSGGYATIYR